MTKVHKHRNPVKPYVMGTICIFCMKDYQSRAKLVNHLCYHSAKCKNMYMSRDPLPSDIFEKQERETALHAKALRHSGRSQLYAPEPVCRVYGPLISGFARTRRKVGKYNKSNTNAEWLVQLNSSFLFDAFVIPSACIAGFKFTDPYCPIYMYFPFSLVVPFTNYNSGRIMVFLIHVAICNRMQYAWTWWSFSSCLLQWCLHEIHIG